LRHRGRGARPDVLGALRVRQLRANLLGGTVSNGEDALAPLGRRQQRVVLEALHLLVSRHQDRPDLRLLRGVELEVGGQSPQLPV
jgi:hypothetical protein